MRRTLAADRDAPSRARQALVEVVEIADSSTRYRAQLLVSELVSHVTAAAGEDTCRLELAFSIGSSRLRVEVRPEGRCPILRPGEPGAPELGWELQAVAKLADRWGIHSDKSSMLWFELEL